MFLENLYIESCFFLHELLNYITKKGVSQDLKGLLKGLCKCVVVILLVCPISVLLGELQVFSEQLVLLAVLEQV